MNSMCKDCLCLGKTCGGTNNPVWTGCVFKEKAKREENENGVRTVRTSDE